MIKRLALWAALSCLVVFGFSERATAQVTLNDTPAVISAGVGWFDLVQTDDQAADFRLEYRHGDDFLFLKPWVGLEVTSEGSVWGGIGVLVDVVFYDDFILTGSFAPGFYEEGDGKDLGSALEFRSQIELGYQFENKSRLSLGFSHTSNASIDDDNPGVEVLTLYYHLPIDEIF
ncbi:acyloxyacyl hydrolase [Pelagibius sp.]|uniref:acyloxyacyl hydrolase n=1 Tax=Pelagibius sp. TaxID=1931238 RepID=UPI003BAE5AAA